MFECTKCHQSLNSDQFYKDSTKKRGHASWCKNCSNDRFKNLVKVTRPKIIREVVQQKQVTNTATKLCGKCKHWKYREYFSKSANTSDGLYFQCKLCTSKSTALYRKNNKDKKAIWIKNTVGGWASTSLKHARHRGLEISITFDDLVKLYHSQNGKCALTGVEFVLGDVSDHRPSVDRIDPTRGYHIDNVRITTWRVNRTKSNLSDAEYIDMCRAVCGHITDSRGTQPLLRILNPFSCNELSRYV